MRKFIFHTDTRGFTLIETLVYLSLFSLIMGGVVVSAFQVFESTGRSQTRAMIQEEGDFLVGKVDWVLSGIQGINAPPTPAVGTPCTQSDTLSVTKWDGTIGTVVMNLSGGNIVIARSGGSAKILNNSNTTVSNLLFKHCFAGGTNPESIVTSFTVSARTPNGMLLTRDFFTSDYVRK